MCVCRRCWRSVIPPTGIGRVVGVGGRGIHEGNGGAAVVGDRATRTPNGSSACTLGSSGQPRCTLLLCRDRLCGAMGVGQNGTCRSAANGCISVPLTCAVWTSTSSSSSVLVQRRAGHTLLLRLQGVTSHATGLRACRRTRWHGGGDRPRRMGVRR